MSAPADPGSARPTRCLLVEADATTATRLREVMQQAFAGIVPHHAASAAQARLMSLSVRPDVVVVGTNLADSALIAELAHRDPETCVIVCAGHIADDRIFPALRAGACGYLVKHDDAEGLIGEIRRIVAGMRPLTPGLAQQFLRHFNALGRREHLEDDEYRVIEGIASGIPLAALGARMGAAVEERVRRVYEKLARSARPDPGRPFAPHAGAE